MYHYTESGLSNVVLANGYNVEIIDGEEYTSIANGIVESNSPLTNEEFKFLRVEMNISQKALGERFDVNEQTIARYEKATKVPRITDAALRSLYQESLDKNNPMGYFLDLLADAEAKEAKEIIMEEVDQHWKIAA